MLTVLFTIFIAPLELFMRAVFEWAHGTLASYGWAIVVMSLVVNTIILPIYNKAEGWQEEERRIKKSFETREEMIKRVFKGQERFAMLTTMRRQAGYSSFLAFRSSVGFFLQIPFFIAAYHLLSTYEAIRGVAFWPIGDLGAPDGLIALGGFSINVLPIVMTAINLLSAFVYTASLTKQDKIQLYVLSGLFLVLLYNSPAGLVFYWTLNNVYSLGKNVVEKSLLPKFAASHGESFVSYWNTSALKLIGKFPSWKILVLFALVAFFAAAGLGAYSWHLFRNVKPIIHPSLEAFALLLVATPLFLWMAAQKFAFVGKKADLPVFNLVGTLVIFATVAIGIELAFFTDLDNWYENLKEPPRIAFLCMKVTAFAMVPSVIAYLNGILEGRLKDGVVAWNRLWLPTAVFWIGLLFFALPTLVVYSDPTAVSASLADVFAVEALAAIAGSFAYWLFGKSMMPRLRGVASLIMLALFVASVLYAFLFVGDYGVIMDGILDNPPGPVASWADCVIDLVIYVSIIAAVYFLVRYAGVAAVARPLGTFAALFIVCVVGLAGSAVTIQTDGISKNDPKQYEAPAYGEPLYSFSPKQNLVMLVFDMFTGDHLPTILEENKDIADALEGFVWFKDTVAVGSGTAYGLATATGGPRYIATNINAEKSTKTFRQIYGESYAEIPNLLPESWNMAVSGWVYEPPKGIFKKEDTLAIAHGRQAKDWFNYFYAEALADAVGAEAGDAFVFLFSISSFKAAPYSLRGKIYRKGAWFLPDRASMNGFISFSPLRALSERSKVKADQPETYRYFYFDATHTGMYFDGEGNPTGKKLFPTDEWRDAHPDYDYQHYLGEVANLRKLVVWLDWLKKEGIYDKTRIVITSDHGGNDTHTLREAIGLVSLRGREDKKTLNSNPGLRYPLLMLKDFNQRGPVVTDETSLMSNADGVSLMLEGVADVPANMKADSKNPERIRIFESSDDRDLDKSSLDTFTYEVKGTMFKKENWTLLPK